jgi:hypothetical protein
MQGREILRDHPAVGHTENDVDPTAELFGDHPGEIVGHVRNGVPGWHVRRRVTIQTPNPALR